MANRIKGVLPKFINKAQVAFVGGRKIVEYVLLSQELLDHYDRVSAKEKRCAIEVNLMKAYDSIRWEFALQVLKLFGFPDIFVGRVGECMKTPRFSVAINGNRQDVHHSLEECLGDFHKFGRFRANPSERNIFFFGIKDNEKNELLHVFGFEEGNLPMKYLGVPLITKKLRYTECKPFVDKILARINSWNSKFLSYTDMIILLKAVLSSIQMYCSSIITLPSKIHEDIEASLRAFLWLGPDMKKNKAKIRWEDVCASREEWGLGIIRSNDWNKAVMTRHLWNVIQNQSASGWVD
ncbi:uncharacterized protein LOC116144686 [Pistacia vera]|uniref:uncharacterized protein LOC116144686 n=1 Tax=Pistacia vera TaxID=55513 RepID=UPI001263CEBE|nr:uncharacterized protein LOC116144686 [Pistacia vera]